MKKIILIFSLISCLAIPASVIALPAQAITTPANYVYIVSVDGLRPDAVTSLGPAGAPNFYRLMAEGAYTLNARNDYDITVTLPNHVTMVTSRGVNGLTGHNWTSNSDPLIGQTIHSNKGSYVASFYDVAHDHGLRTCLYASKTKFSLIDTSYNVTYGALDATGVDNGRDKIDEALITEKNSAAEMSQVLSTIETDPCNIAFVHFYNPDAAGHASGWDPTPGTAYSNSVKTVDDYLGQILNAIAGSVALNGHTTVIVTSDHGGLGTDHSNPSVLEDYRIPFFTWGQNAAPAAALYTLNTTNRLDPGESRPTYAAIPQPIRNGEVGNLGLYLLGLPAIPSSTLNASQDLALETSSSTLKPPIANAGSDQILTDSDNNNIEAVVLDGTASTDPDGTIVLYKWSEGEIILSNLAKPALSFTVGSHTILLAVTDNDGLTSQDTVVITVKIGSADITPPTLAIKKPLDGETLSGRNVKITAIASDASGIASINIFIDGGLKKICTAVTDCSYSWLLKNAVIGSHTITATAIDSSPNANSSVASITVIK